ncbi:MAG: PEP-CTERM sorting domain-containing protein [bacterium]
MKRSLHIAFLTMICISSALAQDGTIFYSSDFNNLNGWSAQLTSNPDVGGSLQSNNPFVVGSTTMGSYMAAYFYPTTLVTPAVASTDPSVWLGFLLRGDSSTTWLGGVNITGGTNNSQVQYVGPWIGQVGSLNQHNSINLADANWSWAPNSLSFANGQDVAVVAHFYDTNSSGTYNTADLWVQTNLATPLFQDLSSFTAIDYGFDLGSSSGNSTINSLRLAGEYGTQYFDNLILTSSSNTAIQFLQTGTTVPEPSTYALFSLGAIGMLVALRKKMAA